ncbi:MAG: B12-binding domain-containing radical SAM protein, partial [Anaerolineae bacterium]|nr:B12-binding domain-containing radical SAM protein [Anaerolineae bacterium]
DRDLTVAGRHSKRFYSFATRWMVSEVALHREKSNGGVGFLRELKLRANIAAGQLGMALTQHQVENGGQPL